MMVDAFLALGICISALFLFRDWTLAAASWMLMNFNIVYGYEYLTKGYAVDGAYVFADIFSALGLLVTILFMGRAEYSRAAVLVLLGFFVCWIIHGLHIAGLLEVQPYWWAIRFVNACQIIVLGSAAGVSGGKLFRRALPGRLRHGRADFNILASRERHHR